MHSAIDLVLFYETVAFVKPNTHIYAYSQACANTHTVSHAKHTCRYIKLHTHMHTHNLTNTYIDMHKLTHTNTQAYTYAHTNTNRQINADSQTHTFKHKLHAFTHTPISAPAVWNSLSLNTRSASSL